VNCEVVSIFRPNVAGSTLSHLPPSTARVLPLGYSTKTELVYQHLREMIVNGRLKSGEHLFLQEIAAQLEVSTNPVREAFRRLESEGLILNRPHAGATVAGVAVEKIDVHFMIRAALEGLAVRLAAVHATAPALDQLAAFDRQLRQLVASGDMTSWNETNIAFHRFLFDCSGSPELVAMIDLQRDRSPRFRHFPDALAQRARESDEPRSHLLTALRARDGELAESLHRATVTRTGQLLCAAMREVQTQPSPNGQAHQPGALRETEGP
jgi:DNA-binding GntR family transcriptional regulator